MIFLLLNLVKDIFKKLRAKF